MDREESVMIITMHLTPETAAKFREHARFAGENLEELALEALRHKLSNEIPSAPVHSSDEWVCQFDSWVNAHSSRNPQFDDSRERIYPDRQ
ncbi:MAG: hypothetical protein U1D30_05890 [Planctomycetota bacterium]